MIKGNGMKRGLEIVMSLLLLLSTTGCALFSGEKGDKGLGNKAKPNESGMSSFYYGHNGSSMESNGSYTVRETEDGAEIVFEMMRYSEFGEISLPVERQLLEQLNDLYLKHKVYQWDGYSRYNPNVLDGDGFTLSISFADGKSMSAHGSNAYPDGYRDFENELDELIAPYMSELQEKIRAQKIANGVHGKLNHVMITIIQHGKSGLDKYEIILFRKREGRNNLDIRITSVSGEFIEAGKYNYYAAVDDEDIGFDTISEIIEKHQIINWSDYDKAAEDYNNSEWFQISFDYDEGHISAMGSEHPENYDAFRKELLEYITEMMKKVAEKYQLENRNI